MGQRRNCAVAKDAQIMLSERRSVLEAWGKDQVMQNLWMHKPVTHRRSVLEAWGKV